MNKYKKEIDFWRIEWQMAKKDGQLDYAKVAKEKFEFFVIESLKRPYNEYYEELKQFPMIMLN